MAALDAQYYYQTCPEAEKIILDTVQNASMHDPKVPARILRMFFHDCFIRVCTFPLLWSISIYFSLKFYWVSEVCCGYRKLIGMRCIGVARLNSTKPSRERWPSQYLSSSILRDWWCENQAWTGMSTYSFLRWHNHHCIKRCSSHGNIENLYLSYLTLQHKRAILICFFLLVFVLSSLEGPCGMYLKEGKMEESPELLKQLTYQRQFSTFHNSFKALLREV